MKWISPTSFLVKDQLAAVAILGLLNTFALPSQISTAHINNVEIGAHISLERSSPPLAALEDISSPELTDPVVENESAVQPVRILAESKVVFSDISSRAKVMLIEPQRLSKNSTEFKILLAAAAQVESKEHYSQTESDRSNINNMQETQSTQARKNPVIQTKDFKSDGGSEVSGLIELGNVAFVGGDQTLSIQRFEGRVAREPGSIDAQQGTFKIKVSERVGKLVAQLKDKSNKVVGEGFYNLVPQAKDDKIKIKIFSKGPGLSGEVISAYSYNDKKFFIKGARLRLADIDRIIETDEQGRFAFEGIAARSVAIITADLTGYKPSIQFTKGEGQNQVVMYPQKMTEALLSFAKPYVKQISGLSERGIIWGQVVSDGRPVSGATVELAGFNSKPIYFNSYVPDLNKIETGSDGYFAYAGVPRGMHQLRGSFLNRVFDGVVVPVERDHISPVTLELSGEMVEKNIGMFDFSGGQRGWLSGALKVLGIEETKDVFGADKLAVAAQKAPIFLEATAPNFLSGKFLAEPGGKDAAVPMVPQRWLVELAKNSQKELDYTRSAALLVSENPIESISINGIAVEKNNQNIIEIEGRGIIILNLNVGVNTIVSKVAGIPDLIVNTVISDASTVTAIDLLNTPNNE